MKKKQQQWYRQTEKLLYTYKSYPLQRMALMQQLENLKIQLMPSLVPSYEPQYSANRNVSNPVERAVIERNEGEAVQKLELKIKNLEYNIEMIETAMDIMLKPEQKDLVRMHYFEQRAWNYIADVLGLSKSTYFRERSQIIKVLAWSFCYLPANESIEFMDLFNDPTLWTQKRGNNVGITWE